MMFFKKFKNKVVLTLFGFVPPNGKQICIL